MVSNETPPKVEGIEPSVFPDHEYSQTTAISFDGLAGSALAKYLEGISPTIRSGGIDQEGNDRLVAVLPFHHKDKLRRVHAAGFRTAEIDTKNRLYGVELVPEDHRTPRVRVDIHPEITNT